MAAAPRRRRRRVWFVLLAALLVVLLIEVAGAVTWRLLTGEWFTWSGAQARRSAVSLSDAAVGDAAAARQQAVQRAANQAAVVHPYLGFVSNAENGNVAGFEVSSYGFVDDASPLLQRGDDRFVLGLVGGSVALQLGLYAEDVLATELQKSAALRGKRIELVRLGLGGFKQPQQMFAVQLAWLLGGEFDCVINLDGFNEVALVDGNVSQGVPGWFPRGWARLLDTVPTPDQQRRLGQLVVLREQRTELVAAGDGTWWSPTLQCWWWWRDRSLADRIASVAAAVEGAASAPSFAVTGPGLEGRDAAAAREQAVEVWRRASLQLHALCRQRDTRYLHFLQPNQYVADAKPMGPEEARVAVDRQHPYAPAVVHGYPLLRLAGEELRRAGVAFTDLTRVFRDHPEPLYVDTCCHFGRRGNQIVAARIAAAVREQLDLEGFVAERLLLRPPQVQLGSPLQAAPLTVVAVAADGREVDVSGAGFGTEILVEPVGAVVVGPDGSLRARRRGRSQLQVRFRGLSATASLVATWPDVLVADDGRAPEGRSAPALRSLAGGGGVPSIACADLPVGGLRVLAASLEPLPATIRPGQESFGVATGMLSGEGPSVTAEAPIQAPPGQPLFLRVYVISAQNAAVLAASNSLVVTRN